MADARAGPRRSPEGEGGEMSSKYPEEFERYREMTSSRKTTFSWRTLLLPIVAIVVFVGSMIWRYAGADDPVQASHTSLEWRFQLTAYHLFPEVGVDDIDCDTSQAPQTRSGNGIILSQGDRFACVYTEVKLGGETVEHPFTIEVTETRHEYRRRQVDKQVYLLRATPGHPGIATTFPEVPQP